MMLQTALFVAQAHVKESDPAGAIEVLNVLAANTSLSQAELETVKGIGPAIAGKMLDERKKSPFKDWADMVARVKGVGEGNAAKFSTEGLTVNGQAFNKSAAAPAAAKTADKPAATENKPAAAADKPAKAEEKADKKAAKKAEKAAKAEAAASAAPAAKK